MGNQSSRSRRGPRINVDSADSLYDPNAKSSAYDQWDSMSDNGASLSRSATARNSPAVHNSLSVPAHRRARSAVARSSSPSTNTHSNVEPVPPPYAVAVAQSAANPASSSLSVPQSSTPSSHRHSWAGATQGRAEGPASAYSANGTPAGVPPLQSQSAAQRAEHLRRPMRQSSVENALDTLRKYNTVLVIDDSGSMQGERWQEARDALSALADVASKYDADGVDICFLNDKHVGTDVRDPQVVKRIFDHVRPRGITPIGEKLEELLLFYIENLERAKRRADAGDHEAMKDMKPVNFIVITDGAPTDDPEEVIVTAARRLDRNNFPLTQVGIQFLQIGDDPQVTEFLNELDNGLSQNYGIRDIVDTTPYLGGRLTADLIIKILLGGINRRVDRRGGQSVI